MCVEEECRRKDKSLDKATWLEKRLWKWIFLQTDSEVVQGFLRARKKRAQRVDEVCKSRWGKGRKLDSARLWTQHESMLGGSPFFFESFLRIL